MQDLEVVAKEVQFAIEAGKARTKPSGASCVIHSNEGCIYVRIAEFWSEMFMPLGKL